MTRVLLILPSATYRAHDFTRAAADLGAELVVASDRRQAMSAFLGDRALVLPLSRPEEAADRIVGHALRVPLDAVVAVDDQGVRTAALASERLGLKANAPHAVARTRDKAAMRNALAAAGVPQPAFRHDVAGAAELGFPVVVKPLSLAASRGVIRADDAEQAAAAAERIRAITGNPEERLLVESFVPGEEVAVEGLLRGGDLEVLAIFDKPDPLDGPYFEETIYVTPSRKPAAVQGRVRAIAADAARALGLTEGPVHAELRVDGDRVTLLELAARSIGGLCSRALRFGAGVSLEEVILRHALDLPLDDLARSDRASGVMMLPIPRAGVLEEVRGQDDARAVPGVAGLEIAIASGRPVVPLPEGDRYLGFVFARGESPEEVEAALRAAHGKLEVGIREDSSRGAAYGGVMGSAFPVFYVRDVEATARFYRDLVGFTELFRLPEDGPAGYVGLMLGESRLGLVDAQWPMDTIGIAVGSGPRAELFVYVDDVDATAARAEEAGGRLLRPPGEMPWGERVAYVQDPEGNPVALATPVEPAAENA